MRLRHPVGEMVAIARVPTDQDKGPLRVRNRSNRLLPLGRLTVFGVVGSRQSRKAGLGNRRAGKQIFATFDLRISEIVLFCVVFH
jgi:hypothetical protein